MSNDPCIYIPPEDPNPNIIIFGKDHFAGLTLALGCNIPEPVCLPRKVEAIDRVLKLEAYDIEPINLDHTLDGLGKRTRQKKRAKRKSKTQRRARRANRK